MLHCNFPIDNWLSFFSLLVLPFSMLRLDSQHRTEHKSASNLRWNRARFSMKSERRRRMEDWIGWKNPNNSSKAHSGGVVNSQREFIALNSLSLTTKSREIKKQRALFSISISPLRLWLYVQTVWMSWNMKRALFSPHFNWEIFQAVCNVFCCAMKGLALCWWLGL